MRARIEFAAGIVGLLCFITGIRAATPAESSSDAAAAAAADQRAVLDDAVRVALQRELEGNDIDRNSLLQHVLEQNANHRAARAHLGYVSTGEAWVPYPELLKSTSDRGDRLSQYRDHRATCDDTVADNLLLANLAHERELWDEERAHLIRVVELDWDNAEARMRLGDVKIDGFWVAREEVEAFARRVLQTRRDRDVWMADVDQLVGRMFRSRRARDSAWSELMAIRNPAAIPAVEEAFAGGDELAAGWYLDWLRELDAWEASVALARQAVFAPSAAVRIRAQHLLRERRIDDYVPALLAAMRADLELDSRLFVTPFAGIAYVDSVAYETQNEVRRRSLAVLYGPETVSNYPRRMISQDSVVPPMRFPELGLGRTALSHLENYGPFTSQQGRWVQTATSIANDRASRTLAEALQISGRNSPHDWWEWWNDYQQVHVSGRKREVEENYEEFWAVERRHQIHRMPRRIVLPSGSCFAAGTHVVTEDGPRPIEDVVLGDRVLAQDVDTGEIAFKPVFNTTVRPPVALLNVITEDAGFLCTNGHPFWIDGLGWRYAWELEPGMRFHSVGGSSEVLSVEESGREEQAYNLVVADFHTYFVGEGRILSHDNSPRNPTNALVPGLMPDWSAAVVSGD